MSSINPILRYSLLPLFSLFLHFLTLTSQPISLFSLQGFHDLKIRDSYSYFSLLGDARFSNEGSFLNLTSPSSGSGSAQIVYNNPFMLFDSKLSKPVSFSTDFTFSILPGDGDGVAFVIFPSGELSTVFGKGQFGISEKFVGKLLAIVYDTRKGGNVGVDVGSFLSVVVSNVSAIGLVLDGGKPLKSWIDYEASSKRLEIRLGKSGAEKPYQSLISHSIDLSKMWGDKEVLVGISSSSGKNSSQTSCLSSWSFGIRTVPSSMHSQPLDPMARLAPPVEHPEVPRKKNCFLTILGTLIFATGCGTLVAFGFLFLWVVFVGSHSTIAPELPLNPMECKYDKVNVTVDNASDDHNSAN